MDSIGVPISQFADICGIPRPSMSQLLNGRNKRISDDVINKIHNAYPDLSILWLMFGEGEMVKAQNIETSEPQNGVSGQEQRLNNVGNQDNTSLFGQIEEFSADTPEKSAEGAQMQFTHSSPFETAERHTEEQFKSADPQHHSDPQHKDDSKDRDITFGVPTYDNTHYNNGRDNNGRDNNGQPGTGVHPLDVTRTVMTSTPSSASGTPDSPGREDYPENEPSEIGTQVQDTFFAYNCIEDEPKYGSRSPKGYSQQQERKVSITPSAHKKISNIVVFYSDNSFQSFIPE